MNPKTKKLIINYINVVMGVPLVKDIQNIQEINKEYEIICILVNDKVKKCTIDKDLIKKFEELKIKWI